MKMEEIDSNMNQLEAKQRSASEALESIRAQADSMVLVLSAKWKEAEGHLDSVRNSLRTEFQQLQQLKNETGSRLADLEAKESKFDLEMGAKSKELQGIVHKVEQGKTQLHSLKLSVKHHCEKSAAEEIRLGKLQKSVKDKEDEFYNILVRCKKVSENIEAEEKQLKSVSVKVKLKDDEIRGKQAFVEEYERQMKLKEEELGLIEKLVLANTAAIRDQDIRLGELKKVVKDCELEYSNIQQRCKQVSKEIESKEMQLDAVSVNVDSKNDEIRDKQALIAEYDGNLKLKEQELISIHKLLKQQQGQIRVKIEQLEQIPDNTAAVVVPTSISTSTQSSTDRDGRSLQLFMNEYFNRTDFVAREVVARLRVSLDPAKLVLDAMQGFYASSSSAENQGLSVTRRSCIHLLKELKRVSPEINAEVRGEAKKLAGYWKGKMIVANQNWLEVLGFLWLISAYDLKSTYDAKELQPLLPIAAEHEQSAELLRMFEVADKEAPESSIIGAPIEPQKPESSLGKNAETFSSPTLQLTATTDDRNLQGRPNEPLRSDLRLVEVVMCGLISTLKRDQRLKFLNMISQVEQAESFRDMIPGFILKLIENKQLIEAVGVICTFNVIDKFPPVPLLKEYVEYASTEVYMERKSLDEKDKVVDDQITGLRAVVQCIKDYNLESEYPSGDIETKMAQLLEMKDGHGRRSPACLASKVEQKLTKRKIQFGPKFQPQWPKRKCQRTAEAVTAKGNCHHCQELGHWKRNCPKYLAEKKNLDMIKALLQKVPSE